MSTSLVDQYVKSLEEALDLDYTEAEMAGHIKDLNRWLRASVEDTPTYYRLLTDVTEILESRN